MAVILTLVNFSWLLFSILTVGPLDFVNCDDSNTNVSNSELLSWDPPAELKNRFPYYLIGHDKEDFPVFLVEFGKWDIRSFLESELPEVKYFEKYADQAAVRYTSPELLDPVDPKEAPPKKFVFIADLDGYEVRQVVSAQSLQTYLNFLKRLVAELRKKNNNIKKGIFVNSNFVFQQVWNLMKPIFGETISFMELYGTKTNKWKPALLDIIDKEQLPESLGGVKGHKILKVYG